VPESGVLKINNHRNVNRLFTVIFPLNDHFQLWSPLTSTERRKLWLYREDTSSSLVWYLILSRKGYSCVSSVTLIDLICADLFEAEALLATLAGIIFGPIALGIFDPGSWSEDPEYLTFQITRIIIAIQVLFTGIALPKAYLLKEWRSLLILVGPVMTTAWFVCGGLIYGLIPGLTFLESLVIGSCVTPTDPVLANSICKGEYTYPWLYAYQCRAIRGEACPIACAERHSRRGGCERRARFPFLVHRTVPYTHQNTWPSVPQRRGRNLRMVSLL